MPAVAFAWCIRGLIGTSAQILQPHTPAETRRVSAGRSCGKRAVWQVHACCHGKHGAAGVYAAMKCGTHMQFCHCIGCSPSLHAPQSEYITWADRHSRSTQKAQLCVISVSLGKEACHMVCIQGWPLFQHPKHILEPKQRVAVLAQG